MGKNTWPKLGLEDAATNVKGVGGVLKELVPAVLRACKEARPPSCALGIPSLTIDDLWGKEIRVWFPKLAAGPSPSRLPKTGAE